MTAPRKDDKSTEFGLWLREQERISSSIGFVATNVDYMWRNYHTDDWMLIEEKRYGVTPKFPQTELFEILDKSIKDKNYKGFHLLVFENTSPDDGEIHLDGNKITKEQLIKFLKFEDIEQKELTNVPQ